MTVIFKYGVLKLYTSATSEINDCCPWLTLSLKKGKLSLQTQGCIPENSERHSI